MRTTLKNDRGIALVVVLAMMVILLSITGGALLLSGLNLKTASNLKSGGGAIHAADAGIQHALTVIPTGTTFSYSTSTPVASSATSFNGYTYTVTAINDSASTGGNTRAILTSAATGPNSSKRTIKAYVGRSTTTWTPPGAVYIPGASTSPVSFDPSGTSFTVTGNDTNYDNTSGSQPSLIGITSPTSSIITNVNNALNSDAKRQRVTGSGYAPGPPVIASVQTTSTSVDVQTMATNFINQVTAVTCPPKCTNGLSTSTSTCPTTLPTPRPVPDPCILGTDAAPQVTYLKQGTDHIHLDGNVTGSGVLVVEGMAHIQGDFNFHGIIIQLAPATDADDVDESNKFFMQGNARLYGGLLLGPNNQDLRFKLKSTAAIRYSSTAINMVNTNWGSCCAPKAAKLIAWSEVMQ